MAVDGRRADRGEFRLGQRAACDRNFARLVDAAARAGGAQVAQELIGRLADQRVEDERRARGEDRLDDLAELGAANREIALGDNSSAVRRRSPRAGSDCSPRPRYSLSRRRTPSAPTRLSRYSTSGSRCWFGDGAGVDDVVRALEALIVRGIPEQRVGLLEAGNDLLAAGRGVAADDVLDAAGQHLRGHRRIARKLPRGIGDDWLELDVAVLGLRLGDGEKGAAEHAAGDDAVRAVRGNQDADRNTQFGHGLRKLPKQG